MKNLFFKTAVLAALPALSVAVVLAVAPVGYDGGSQAAQAASPNTGIVKPPTPHPGVDTKPPRGPTCPSRAC